MGNYFQSSAGQLIDFVLSAYMFVVLLRLILDKVGANYYNQISQVTIRLTDPVVKVLRRVLPHSRKIDVPTLVFLVIISFNEGVIVLRD